MHMERSGKYRVIIAGSRSFRDYELLKAKCDAILDRKGRTHEIVIVSGTARGTDKLGERYAREHGYQSRQFPANWASFGKVAGIVRNSDMARNADALIAFWDGKSPGTRNMIENARRLGLPVRVIMFEDNGEKQPIQLDIF